MALTGKRKVKAAFTLAELLVVLAIMGLLFVLALPMFGTLTVQSRLEAAANAVHSAAKMARQYAVAHHQPTYLVFNEGQTGDEAAYRAYAVFSINVHTNARPVPQAAGYFATGWEHLPAGVVFDPFAGGTTNIFNPTADQWNGALSKRNELRIGNEVFIVQGFSPEGASGSASHFIFLAEGFTDGGRPVVHAPGAGKQIRFSTLGKSRIVDVVYDSDGMLHTAGAE